MADENGVAGRNQDAYRRFCVTTSTFGLGTDTRFVLDCVRRVHAGGGQPAFRVIRLLTQMPLTVLAPILKTTPERLLFDLMPSR